MRCPTLSQLPPPPPGKTGFPWTEESPQLPDTLPSGQPYPRISIVTPSYQQGAFIEETIRSILLQGYPNLEYMITDAGSTDETVEIIRKYEPFISYWVSEPDRGQSHAINKGWAIATGDIFHYLNSDDLLLPETLATVAHTFASDATIKAVCGVCPVKDIKLEKQIRVKLPRDFDLEHFLLDKEGPGQPATFVAREIVEKVGEMDESLYFTMDREYWMRVSLLCPGTRVAKLDQPLAIYRWRSECKSAQGGVAYAERLRLLDKYYSEFDLPTDLRQLRKTSYANTFWMMAWLFRYEKRKLKSLMALAKSLYWQRKPLKPTVKFLLEYF